ncbi:DEAD/DEAH box helicase (plasmid) [Euhalothece natronophila Z-M001]|uniref:DEAD/DEAH box helicase n=1 Tax=Euhalothece natronophila Z-M001 TaxID=522448 RepID=A0A5B8NRG9_9CHRO|nr:helicase-related protein [Euhalothece natronophila]QDZ41674.1 DEAD/DEAH box helicase [Euhalothece natronophila Z-M001]
MQTLPDYHWRIGYSSNEHNPILDFYIPALERSVQYDRKSGFFNSRILSKVAQGLGAMLDNNGKMRLIMGCQFSQQDLEAIKQGYKLRDALTNRLDAELTSPETFVELKHFEILSWLIQNEYLDIKIAIPLQKNGVPEFSPTQINPQQIFHEKVGIFTDADNNQLVFLGSNNESLSGWEQNVESFHVYCSWEEGRDLERVSEEVFRFEQLWNNFAPNVQTFDVPEAVRQKILRYTPNTKPTWNQKIEFDTRPLPNTQTANQQQITNEEKQQWDILLNLPNHEGSLDFCLKTIPITPWLHQIKILRHVANKFPHSFLIADEVGLGKTIETGLILRYLLITQKVKRVLVLSPASVQTQWQEELREKFNLHFWNYSKSRFQDCYGKTENHETFTNPWDSKNLVLASSHLIRRQERMEELLAATPWDLVILDEAHHARRKTPQARKDNPNRLLTLMQQLRETGKAKSLILLSATPMQIDPIEVFDLLHLFGLKGHWQYGDNFCNYFASLGDEPNANLLDFWQQMCYDYFRYGGTPCPRFQQYLKEKDRVLAYQLQDTWEKGKKIANHKSTLTNKPFLNTSRQYLTINTPLKDYMFRHTRDTLREYYQRGMLEQEVPTREVQDHAINLEPSREIPLYRAVSDYVRDFYRLAQKQERKALGFLMTLYRKRLTSSFYAIRQSLQRRLEGISVTEDDLLELDEVDDAVISGLESYLAEPVDPKEIEYLEELLRQFENTGEDSKLSFLISLLSQEFLNRESILIFTQYTDTMDYLRESLQQLYGTQLGCYSGRGGEIYEDQKWRIVPKEEIKRSFRDREIKLLICTESASEGLNLQTCGVLINYDLPWNPMRVEQRIGRLDRIGQQYSTVRIHNLYYDGTVEAKVYRRLRDRINLFQNVVGHVQPILAEVPTFIEKAVMSADPQEEDVLMAEFEQNFKNVQMEMDVDDLITRDVDADLAEVQKPLPTSPISPKGIEQLMTTSQVLASQGVEWIDRGDKTWQVKDSNNTYQVTFYPEVFAEDSSLRFMNFGDPLFEEFLTRINR